MTAKEVAVAYMEAFASGQVDSIIAWVTDDFVNDQVGDLGKGCQGKEVYQQRLVGFLDYFSNLKYDVQRAIGDGDNVAVTYRMSFNHGSENHSLQGVMVMKIRDSKVAYRADYWDGVTYERLTGQRTSD